ncbi:MAG: hypothetical protein IKK02_03905 [Tidjanibacter sp.]|nr:hypothetical protein [Tidjanibacter sp.]MBR6813648.1 hypothetical protein [Tidjanibacter sp.]
MKTVHQQVDSVAELLSLLRQGGVLRGYAFCGLDFPDEAVECRFERCLFMGCRLSPFHHFAMGEECYVFPSLPKPYHTFLAHLYTPEELYDRYDPASPESFDECYDTRVYRHYISTGKEPDSVGEHLARSMHDHSVSVALHDMLDRYPERGVVAVMGGHSLARTDATYRSVALISKRLTEAGLLVCTGGGPGAMEAAHLGAWLAGRADSVVDEALEALSVAPTYKDSAWLSSAWAVRERWPRGEEWSSVGIPTWFYGHEPATPFASHVAKYFDNSIREDGLLAIAKGGVIYSPGSAGTMQEIFQDAAQNHYATFGPSAPMVFLGTDYWSREVPIYPLLADLLSRGKYKDLRLTLSDSPDEIVATFLANLG